MLWLYLLAAVTFLVIVLRRVLRRQKPLDDELYSKRVAIDHVHSGVAWVGADGKITSLNKALAVTLEAKVEDLVGHEWLMLFPQRDRGRVREAYSQALLLGIASLDAHMERTDGSMAWVNVMMVAVHDHRMRFVGHHCLTVDRTRQMALEEQVKQLAALLAKYDPAASEASLENLRAATADESRRVLSLDPRA
jgi:PAS domain S-box-containing protein